MNEQSEHKNQEFITLEGSAAVKGALLGGMRRIERILLSRRKKPNRSHTWLLAEAERRGVVVERVEAEDIDQRADGRTHGGLIAEAGVRRYSQLEEMAVSDESEPARMIVMLDGIEDPYNLGFAIRTLYAAGIDGVVLRSRSWGEGESTILRSSAGTYDLMPIAQVESAEEGARVCRRAGMTVAATAHGRNSCSLYDADLARPLFLLIGGERRGITRSFLESADLIVHIPYGREFDGSLGAASASAVIGFEAMRQRAPLRSE